MTTETVTIERSKLKLTLDALQSSQQYVEACANAKTKAGWGEQLDVAEDAITAIKEALAQPEQPDLDAICQDLQEKTYNQAMRIAELEARAIHPEQEPFGYFKPEPFGWTDCAETDEGAIALYEKPQPCPTCEALARTVMMDQSSTDQQQRTWVGLTDEERLEVAGIDGADEWFWNVCLDIEAKLRSKNT